MINWGEVYYDHFKHFFNAPVKRNVFKQGVQSPSIQILGYDGVFPHCRVFCSLGLSHYSKELKKTAEICLVADNAWEDCPEILANTLFYLIQQHYEIGWGLAIGGIEKIKPQFVSRYNKTATYITIPYQLPENFSVVAQSDVGGKGGIYWAFFISEKEYRYFKNFGAESFESLIEESNVDPFSLARPSCIIE